MRRSSVSNNYYTPRFETNKRKSNALIPPISGGGGRLVRATSTLALEPRQSTVLRQPRSSSVDRKCGYSMGDNQTMQSASTSGRFSVPNTSGKPHLVKDPRPIMDKGFQTKMIQDLLVFCEENDYPHIGEKQLRLPSRNEFLNFFLFIFGILDENYQFSGQQPVEVEIPDLLRPLGYPFPLKASVWKSFNAPHAWPTILAVLHWLAQVVEMAINYDMERMLFVAENEDFESPILARRTTEPLCSVKYQYYAEYYLQAEAGNDNFEEIDQNLGYTLGVDADTRAEMDELSMENEKLMEELRGLQTEMDQMDAIQNTVATKSVDSAKFDDYFRKVDNYIADHKKALEEYTETKRATDTEIDQLRGDIDRKKALIASQSLKPADVELLISKKEELKKRIAAYLNELQETEKISGQNEIFFAGRREIIETKFGKLWEKIKSIIRTAPTLSSEDCGFIDASPFVPNFLAVVEEEVLPWIEKVQRKIIDEMESTQIAITDHREQIACSKQQLVELELEDEALQAKSKQYEDDLKDYETTVSAGYKEVRKEHDSLEREFESVSGARVVAGEERAANEKLLEQLNKELKEKRAEYEEEEKGWEDAIEKTVAEARKEMKHIEAERNKAIKVLEDLKHYFTAKIEQNLKTE